MSISIMPSRTNQVNFGAYKIKTSDLKPAIWTKLRENGLNSVKGDLEFFSRGEDRIIQGKLSCDDGIIKKVLTALNIQHTWTENIK